MLETERKTSYQAHQGSFNCKFLRKMRKVKAFIKKSRAWNLRVFSAFLIRSKLQGTSEIKRVIPKRPWRLYPVGQWEVVFKNIPICSRAWRVCSFFQKRTTYPFDFIFWFMIDWLRIRPYLKSNKNKSKSFLKNYPLVPTGEKVETFGNNSIKIENAGTQFSLWNCILPLAASLKRGMCVPWNQIREMLLLLRYSQ